MVRYLITLLTTAFLLTSCGNISEREYIDLQGKWRFAIDSLNAGETGQWFSKVLDDEVILPGTTDTNKKGVLNTKNDETSYLSREYSYRGKAWYQREVEIPAGWAGQVLKLTLERTKPTKIWIDNEFVGSQRNLSTKHVYDLTGKLTPGKHVITVMVDNGGGVPRAVLSNSHANTESTQTNWNGIIGDIRIDAMPRFYIKDIKVAPDAKAKKANIKIYLNRPEGNIESPEICILAEACNTSIKHKVQVTKTVDAGSNEVDIDFLLGDDAVLWDEFDPGFYNLSVTIKGKGFSDKSKTTFGLRDFSVKGTQFEINDNITFLRGKHDGCVFPLTGHVAMDTASWREYFRIAKSYGINHYRFHSWCPPDACFEAADVEGIYLQPELPYWGGFNRRDTFLISFLTDEGINIQGEYGNHASFVMFALGNELSGDQEVMTEMVQKLKSIDNRHLYATGSNNFLGYSKHAAIDEFFTTCRVGGEEPFRFNTHARGSFSFADTYDGGYINHTYPNSVMNFDTAVSLCPIPIISHETGQFQIYPNYKEMEKYTGVLKPRNFGVFQERLGKAGMAAQADDFFKASGKWSALLYKADIEMDIRTKGFAGFQLLDLQDYPGQGSAYVGILDAFMDSKGLITPEEWREFCSEVVPLFVTPKFCYENNEPLTGDILIANYSKNAFANRQLEWFLKDEKDNIIDSGTLPLSVKQGDLANIGKIQPKISTVSKASKLMLTLNIPETDYKNSYPLWIFPSQKETDKRSNIIVSSNLDNAMKKILDEGGKVLWFPDHKKYEKVTVGGLFQTDYWNYRMFMTVSERVGKPVSPGTMGLLTNPEHPVFADFPTDFHSNHQWFSMVKNSRPFILDKMPEGYLPIIQVIDNIDRNHKLGLLFELNIGGGKLLVCMSNLPEIVDKPEARQLYSSIMSYMESDKFSPTNKMTFADLTDLFNMQAGISETKRLDNMSYQ